MQLWEKRTKKVKTDIWFSSIDLALVCDDFQSIRTAVSYRFPIYTLKRTQLQTDDRCTIRTIHVYGDSRRERVFPFLELVQQPVIILNWGHQKWKRRAAAAVTCNSPPQAASNTTRVIYTKRVHREGRPLLYSTHRESGRQFLTSDCLFVWARETTQRGESTAKNIKPIGKNLWLRKTNSTCVYIHSTNRLFLSA